MVKELKGFRETSALLDEQISAFRNELREKQSKKHVLEQQYETMLNDDSSLAEINKVRQSIANINSDIEILSDKISKLESTKKTKVEPLLEAARVAYEKELAATYEKLHPVFKEILGYQIKTLELLQQVSDEYKKIDAMYWAVSSELVRQGNGRRHTNLDRFDFNRTLYGVKDHVGRTVEPGLLSDANEMMAAFLKGELPDWVQDHTDKQ